MTSKFFIQAKSPDMDKFWYLEKDGKSLEFGTSEEAVSYIENILMKEDADAFSKGTEFRVEQIVYGTEKEIETMEQMIIDNKDKYSGFDCHSHD